MAVPLPRRRFVGSGSSAPLAKKTVGCFGESAIEKLSSEARAGGPQAMTSRLSSSETSTPRAAAQGACAARAHQPKARGDPHGMISFALPPHGGNINAFLSTAAGAGAHPTVLLLHGFPGSEQNLDLAQAIRRAGWNVLRPHYR